MKASTVLSTALVALGATVWTHPAQADSMQASCEVRKDGEKQKGKSGPCTFGQRQGYIDIDLRNGDVFSLKPTGQPDHFKDQKGTKVVRTRAGGDTQEFKWEGGKKLVVTFDSYSNGNKGYGAAAGYGASGGSSEYQRGYNDATKGRGYDQDRHGQDYKDGFRAGEESQGGISNSGSTGGDGSHSINRMSNGGFEVVWSKHGCIASFNKHGQPMGYSNGCTQSQVERSDQIARNER